MTSCRKFTRCLLLNDGCIFQPYCNIQHCGSLTCVGWINKGITQRSLIKHKKIESEVMVKRERYTYIIHMVNPDVNWQPMPMPLDMFHLETLQSNRPKCMHELLWNAVTPTHEGISNTERCFGWRTTGRKLVTENRNLDSQLPILTSRHKVRGFSTASRAGLKIRWFNNATQYPSCTGTPPLSVQICYVSSTVRCSVYFSYHNMWNCCSKHGPPRFTLFRGRKFNARGTLLPLLFAECCWKWLTE
jgi:hypothetical protein